MLNKSQIRCHHHYQAVSKNYSTFSHNFYSYWHENFHLVRNFFIPYVQCNGKFKEQNYFLEKRSCIFNIYLDTWRLDVLFPRGQILIDLESHRSFWYYRSFSTWNAKKLDIPTGCNFVCIVNACHIQTFQSQISYNNNISSIDFIFPCFFVT